VPPAPGVAAQRLLACPAALVSSAVLGRPQRLAAR
jgi:hypothetical protein